MASGRSGIGIEEILQAICERIPAPVGDTEAPLQALIFDSVFNSFRGIIVYYRIMNGVLKKNDKIRFVASGRDYNADEVGVLKLAMTPKAEVRAGDVGYIITGLKVAKEVKVGDTITLANNTVGQPGLLVDATSSLQLGKLDETYVGAVYLDFPTSTALINGTIKMVQGTVNSIVTGLPRITSRTAGSVVFTLGSSLEFNNTSNYPFGTVGVATSNSSNFAVAVFLRTLIASSGEYNIFSTFFVNSL